MTKSTKRKIVTIAMVICVFALAAAGTLAYFADQTKVVENTFTLGNVKIKLSEGIVDNKGVSTDKNASGDIWDATGTTLRTTRTDTGNTKVVKGLDNKDYGYSLIPGRQVDKDPIVTVLANSEDAYVRVKVTLDNAQNFIDVYKAHRTEATIQDAINAMTDYFVGYSADNWKFIKGEKVGDTVVVTFNYKEVVEKATSNTDLPAVITAVKLPEWVTSADAAKFTNGFSVKIVAEAIQAEGLADETAAWSAFDAQMNPTTASGDDTGATGETTNP